MEDHAHNVLAQLGDLALLDVAAGQSREPPARAPGLRLLGEQLGHDLFRDGGGGDERLVVCRDLAPEAGEEAPQGLVHEVALLARPEVLVGRAQTQHARREPLVGAFQVGLDLRRRQTQGRVEVGGKGGAGDRTRSVVVGADIGIRGKRGVGGAGT